MEPCRHDRRGDRPHGEAGNEEVHDLGTKPSETAVERGAASLDKPGDRIVVVALSPEEVGHHEEHARGEKGELGAGPKEFGRLPDENGDQCRRQGRHPLGASPHSRSETGQPDHDGRPYDRRPWAHKQHVAARDREGRQQRPAAADRQQPDEPTDGIRKDADVQAGDREDMDRAGDREELGIVTVECRSFPEQERRRQAGPSRGEA